MNEAKAATFGGIFLATAVPIVLAIATGNPFIGIATLLAEFGTLMACIGYEEWR